MSSSSSSSSSASQEVDCAKVYSDALYRILAVETVKADQALIDEIHKHPNEQSSTHIGVSWRLASTNADLRNKMIKVGGTCLMELPNTVGKWTSAPGFTFVGRIPAFFERADSDLVIDGKPVENVRVVVCGSIVEVTMTRLIGTQDDHGLMKGDGDRRWTDYRLDVKHGDQFQWLDKEKTMLEIHDQYHYGKADGFRKEWSQPGGSVHADISYNQDKYHGRCFMILADDPKRERRAYWYYHGTRVDDEAAWIAAQDASTRCTCDHCCFSAFASSYSPVSLVAQFYQYCVDHRIGE